MDRLSYIIDGITGAFVKGKPIVCTIFSKNATERPLIATDLPENGVTKIKYKYNDIVDIIEYIHNDSHIFAVVPINGNVGIVVKDDKESLFRKLENVIIKAEREALENAEGGQVCLAVGGSIEEDNNIQITCYNKDDFIADQMIYLLYDSYD